MLAKACYHLLCAFSVLYFVLALRDTKMYKMEKIMVYIGRQASYQATAEQVLSTSTGVWILKEVPASQAVQAQSQHLDDHESERLLKFHTLGASLILPFLGAG